MTTKFLVILIFVVGTMDLVLNLGIGAAIAAVIIAGLSKLAADRILSVD